MKSRITEYHSLRETEIEFTPERPYRVLVNRYDRFEQDLHPHFGVNSFEILICRKVRGVISIDGRPYNVSKNRVLVIPPGVVHSGRIPMGEGVILVFQLSVLAISGLMNIPALFKSLSAKMEDTPFTSPLYGGLEPLLAGLFKRLPKVMTEPDLVRDLPLFCEVIGVLGRAAREAGMRKPRSKPERRLPKRIKDILAWTESNHGPETGLEQAAGAFGLDKHYFCRYFRRHTGFTYNDFLVQVRLERSVRLLREGSSVTDACYDCGFGTLSHFIRTFREHYRMTPLKFRKKYLAPA